MGYSDAQFVIVEHRDREHQHLHVVASRIRPDGTLVRYPYRDWERGMAVARTLEREYGLRAVPRDPHRGKRSPRREEYRLAVEHSQASERLQLQVLVREAWEGGPTLGEFVERLAAVGVRVRFYSNRAGEVSGISYGLDVRAFGGFSLGPSYTWRGIQREGVRYDAARDRAVVERHSGGLRETWVERLRAASPEVEVERVRVIVLGSLADGPTLTAFVERLEFLGVQVRLNVARTGHVSGIRYEIDGRSFKGSELGREFTCQGIQRQGVSYDAERDAEVARRLGGRAPEPPSPASPSRLGRGDRLARLRALVQGATAGRPNLTEFVGRLEAAAVQVRLYLDSNRDVYGIGYCLDGSYVKSKDLGEAFRWGELQVRYQSERDRKTVERIGNVLARVPLGAGGAPSRGRGQETLETLASIVAAAKQGRPSLSEFVARLGNHGVEVRLYRDGDGKVVSVGYAWGTLYAPGRQLGPGHSWQRLEREGLAIDPERDRDVLERTLTPLGGGRGRREPRGPTEADLAQVRAIVNAARVDRPSYSDFVRRVEGAGVAVRLHVDPDGRALSVSYGLGDVSIKGVQLGPGHVWRRLERESVRLDVERDREALRKTAIVLGGARQRREAPLPADLARVRQIVDEAGRGRPTLTEFVRRVEERGIEVRFYREPGGRVVGVGYAQGTVGIRARNLSEACTWRGVSDRVRYHARRDRRAVQVRAREVAPRRGSGLRELTRLYRTSRLLAAWARRPEQMALRLAGRFALRSALQVARELASGKYARSGEPPAVALSAPSRSQRVATVARTLSLPDVPAQAGAPFHEADRALAQLAQRVVAIASRDDRVLGPAAAEAISRVRALAGHAVKAAIKAPERILRHGL